MNDSTCFDRNDTGIISLADLFPQARLPRRADPKRWLQGDDSVKPAGLDAGTASSTNPKPGA